MWRFIALVTQRMKAKWHLDEEVGKLPHMKNLRLLSITRLSLLFTVTSLWACSGTGGTESLNEDIGAAVGDSVATPNQPNDGGGPAPFDADNQAPGDAPTFGKDGEEAAGDTGEGPIEDGEIADPSDGEITDPSDGEITDPSDGGASVPDDGEGTDPTDTGETEASDGETTELEDGEGADPADGGETGTSDGGSTEPGDTEEEEDIVEDVNLPCDGDEGCEEQGDTRCSADGSALIQECKLSGGCLKWIDSEYCQFDEFFPNIHGSDFFQQ